MDEIDIQMTCDAKDWRVLAHENRAAYSEAKLAGIRDVMLDAHFAELQELCQEIETLPDGLKKACMAIFIAKLSREFDERIKRLEQEQALTIAWVRFTRELRAAVKREVAEIKDWFAAVTSGWRG